MVQIVRQLRQFNACYRTVTLVRYVRPAACVISPVVKLRIELRREN